MKKKCNSYTLYENRPLSEFNSIRAAAAHASHSIYGSQQNYFSQEMISFFVFIRSFSDCSLYAAKSTCTANGKLNRKICYSAVF